jgi:hypothetical protein
MSKVVDNALADVMERLKSGETIDRVLGSVAYEYGRKVRDEIASSIRLFAIKGYSDANGNPDNRIH